MKWTPWSSGSGAGEASTGKSISQRTKFTQSPKAMAGFFSVFLLVGLGFLMIFVVPAWRVVASQRWTAVDCEILSSSVGRHSGDDGATYSIDVRYRYLFEGLEYSSDRYQFLGGASSGYEGKKKVVDALPEGSSTTCYVDPDEPSEAVLYRGFSWVYLFAFLPLVFIAVGGGGMAFALFPGSRSVGGVPGGRSRSSSGVEGLGADASTRGAFREGGSWSSQGVSGGRGAAGGIGGTGGVGATTGPIELEEPLGPAGKLGCLVGVCILWNGIVSVFVWRLWSEWHSGAGLDGCLAVFLIPFVLVGLAILVGIPYQMLALANPRPRLVLSRGAVPLGGSAQLDWSFKGSTRRLRDLRIWIEGSERATYRHGTNSHTDTAVFAEIEVARIEGDRPLATGSANIEIPAETMHSFEAPHNKIVWVLKVAGSIAWWPDVIAEFPFIIEPGKGGALE